MPVKISQDEKGFFARWGNEGKKYYYKCNDVSARNEAKRKAFIQGLAIVSEEENTTLNNKEQTWNFGSQLKSLLLNG